MATLKNTKIDDTGYLGVPTGSNAQRPNTGSAGMIRWNTDNSVLEGHDGTEWKQFSFASPSLVDTDGLILFLDPENTDSYPGTGTTWTDLSQNLVFNSQGTQTPYEIKSGAGSFAFNGSGYWRCSSGHGNVDMAGECTLIMWIYSENLGERDTIFEKEGTSYNSYEQEIAVTYEADEALTWYSRYNDYDYGESSAMTVSAWNMMGIKMSSGKTSGVSRTGFYSKNGGNWTSGYTSRSTTPILTAGPIRIGSGYAGAVENGNIGMVIVYNKMLNDTEIQTIYDDTKDRFGLT